MKKAQLKMMETVGILVVFFFLVAFGFIFFSRIETRSFELEVDERAALKAVEKAQQITFMSEIACTEDNVRVDDCIDSMKLAAVSKVIAENPYYYYHIIGFSNISVESVYPERSVVQVYFNSGNLTSQDSFQVPVALCDYRFVPKKCSFALLNLAIYKQ